MSLLPVVIAGIGIGLAFGVFGAGGSAFGTPILALMGVPATIAVASPLPAVLPSALLGARAYLRAGVLDRRVAALAAAAGVPMALLGALASRLVSGHWLLVASGLLLLGVGVRMVVPSSKAAQARGAGRCGQTWFVVIVAAGAGFVAGLLATGGGIVLVPVLVLLLGFTAARAAGTSLVVAAALTGPTVVAHWLLGNIDWSIAGAFALGMIPASLLAARVGPQLPDRVIRPVFGALVLCFGVFFVARQLG